MLCLHVVGCRYLLGLQDFGTDTDVGYTVITMDLHDPQGKQLAFRVLGVSTRSVTNA